MPALPSLLAPTYFCAVLIAAAAVDVTRYRIPNFLPALLAVGALLVLPQGEPEWLSRGLSVGIVALAVLVLYLARAMGGGDVKLLAAASLWMPFPTLPVFVLALAGAGGIQALVTLALRRLRRQPLRSREARRMPYGLSIAAAGLAWAWLVLLRPA